MKTNRISLISALLIALFFHTALSTAQTKLIDINGTVTYNGTPVCAMVLANGQPMFTCGDDLGIFDMEVPLDTNGGITLYCFCSGFAPYKEVLVP